MPSFRNKHSNSFLMFGLVLGVFGAGAGRGAEEDAKTAEARLLSSIRQLTFEGKRAGEGYFSRDGSRMVFQSEREGDNPFYQIYLLDLDTGDVARISPGHGKTTCAWIHPSEPKVMFASTHDDPEARAKQQAEIQFRASGQTRRYAWDYDEHFELYEADFHGKNLKRLTNALGYDAEGSYSPDGQWIAFASNRHAYTDPPTGKDAELFDLDKSYLMDIYLMRADGSDLKRLTDVKGYDGGPFFSPDGRRIVWRRFSENGATAEVYTMDLDGTNQRQITRLGAMSWAPYFHPSGEYVIFATNLHGFDNFELYLVDAAGTREPVRVTYTPGFDGLPAFAPNGRRLAWTTNRTADGSSQIFIADWDHEAARVLLKSGEAGPREVVLENAPTMAATSAEVSPADIRLHVEYLASDFMQGRRTGTLGERRATAYAASVFGSLGLLPAGDGGTFFQEFEFTAGVSLGPDNTLTLFMGETPSEFVADVNWRPLAFSNPGSVNKTEVVFAGYGIRAPKTEEFAEYDSFVHLDVTNKWVLVFRYMPENITPELRVHLNTHSSLRYKAMTLRDLGARGMIVVSGPNSKVTEQLVPLVYDGSPAGTLAAVSVSDAVAQQILNAAGKDLKALQDQLDTGDAVMGFPIPGALVSADIDVRQERQIGRSVLARLPAADTALDGAVVVGAHIDHLGVGRGASSLARDGEADAIHYGADDNASGVGGVFEIAQYLAAEKAAGRFAPKRDIIFGLWSGEELGLLGSDHFVKTLTKKPVHEPIRPEISAYLNMDMIGRMGEKVVLQGVGSSSIWPGEIERRNVPVGLSVAPRNESYLPTDATSFYLRGVPFLNAFTGAHEDYHSPRDTADKVNYEGAAKIARFMGLVARALALRDEAPDYVEMQRPENLEQRANLKAYLGTIPDYTEGDVKGLKISGVTKGAPADMAGLLAGDIIVGLAGRKIENIYDYTYAIEALKVGEPVEIVVLRDGRELKFTVVPGSRE